MIKKYQIMMFFFFFHSGVSFQDVMVRQGVTEAPPKTPFILGFECAGVVEAVADDVENFKVRWGGQVDSLAVIVKPSR